MIPGVQKGNQQTNIIHSISFPGDSSGKSTGPAPQNRFSVVHDRRGLPSSSPPTPKHPFILFPISSHLRRLFRLVCSFSSVPSCAENLIATPK
ncbi:hypothetical protein BO78DRAFT_5841 [Aspergillus sclerotiicarbonarius CBS 121057]|uniref:Uncharacterized protein n=1 Tax=Aspergillus sclerotiicarbonarius (strain CBS 121057 / IBT 28362) TaxID=1448318 RepID=A0A319EQF5_ASPSB|nr:hypothetical protein BO78DRAFT_5841 [Aspergillus sclerotiicarbonarius CBS 121057]